jgi:hypothetical protein
MLTRTKLRALSPGQWAPVRVPGQTKSTFGSESDDPCGHEERDPTGAQRAAQHVYPSSL